MWQKLSKKKNHQKKPQKMPQKSDKNTIKQVCKKKRGQDGNNAKWRQCEFFLYIFGGLEERGLTG